MSKEDVERLEKGIHELKTLITKGHQVAKAQGAKPTVPDPASPDGPHYAPVGTDYEDGLYERFKSRLATEAPALLKLLINVPELEVTVERKTVTADESSTLGMIAILLKDDFFKESRSSNEVWKEMQRRWAFEGIAARAFEQLEKLTSMGFVTKEKPDDPKAAIRYRAVPGMKVNIVKK